MKHRSSNITILLLPAVTNCDIVSKTTRPRQQKSQSNFTFSHQILRETQRKPFYDQWNPLHPTDLGQIHIGTVQHFLGADQTDHQEVYLPSIDNLKTTSLPRLKPSNLQQQSIYHQSPKLHQFRLNMKTLRLQQTIHLTFNARAVCLAIHQTCSPLIIISKIWKLNWTPRTTELWSS